MSSPAIEVNDLVKSFDIPGQRAPFTLRERIRNPLGRTPGRSLPVLKGISFEVQQGEFFGIVGRNGSGKSTLLKLLASVYRADRGRIRVAGRLAPFLELGVGFNPELPAADNVILNGVMMGLTPRAVKSRVDEIIDFAGLSDYTDLLIKNYSSGMKVRLGFAVMTHVDADLLLMDEVLAVGDAEFQDKCADVFEQMHAQGRTILLVTHSMESVKQHCERAMLLDQGTIDTIGDPDDVAQRYYEVNLRAALEAGGGNLPDIAWRMAEAVDDPSAVIEAAWLEGTRSEERPVLEPGAPLEIRAEVSVHRDIAEPGFNFHIVNQAGQLVFASPQDGKREQPLAAGDRFTLITKIENRLPPGRYSISCGVSRGKDEPAGRPKTVRFEVPGDRRGGMVSLDFSFSMERETLPSLTR